VAGGRAVTTSVVELPAARALSGVRRGLLSLAVEVELAGGAGGAVEGDGLSFVVVKEVALPPARAVRRSRAALDAHQLVPSRGLGEGSLQPLERLCAHVRGKRPASARVRVRHEDGPRGASRRRARAHARPCSARRRGAAPLPLPRRVGARRLPPRIAEACGSGIVPARCRRPRRPRGSRGTRTAPLWQRIVETGRTFALWDQLRAASRHRFRAGALALARRRAAATPSEHRVKSALVPGRRSSCPQTHSEAPAQACGRPMLGGRPAEVLRRTSSAGRRECTLPLRTGSPPSPAGRPGRRCSRWVFALD